MTPDLQAFITTVVAVYGAVLASLSLGISIVLAILEIRRQQPWVRVTASHGGLLSAGSLHSEPMIIIEAINSGHGSVVLEQFGFLLKGGGKRILLKPYLMQLPHTLEERRRLTAFYACRWFRNEKDNKKITAVFFKDEAGNMWKGKITRKLRRQIANAPETGYLVEWSPETQQYYPKERAGGPPT